MRMYNAIVIGAYAFPGLRQALFVLCTTGFEPREAETRLISGAIGMDLQEASVT